MYSNAWIQRWIRVVEEITCESVPSRSGTGAVSSSFYSFVSVVNYVSGWERFLVPG